jgi:hypothetical protein
MYALRTIGRSYLFSSRTRALVRACSALLAALPYRRVANARILLALGDYYGAYHELLEVPTTHVLLDDLLIVLERYGRAK